MNYKTDVLSRRNMICAAFRVGEAKDWNVAIKKAEKKFGAVIRNAVAFVSVAEGNCRAAKEDHVDRLLSGSYGWKTIKTLREEALEKMRADFGDFANND